MLSWARKCGSRMALTGLVMGMLLVSAQSHSSRRLRITNGCGSEPLWILSEAQGARPPGPQVLRIEPLQHHDVLTPAGPSSTRFWPKAGCDERGEQCAIGRGSDKACIGANSTGECAPLIGSKLQAAFGDAALPCDPALGQTAGCDHVDVSLADGFSMPFRFERSGKCLEEVDKVIENDVVDCSLLTLDQCPEAETLPGPLGLQVDLRDFDSRTHQVGGCYAPCRKLLDERGNSTLAKAVTAAGHCSPGSDPAGAKDSAYWGAVRQMCRGIHRFDHGDGVRPRRCHASTQYELTFFCRQPTLGVVSLETKPAVAARALSEDHSTKVGSPVKDDDDDQKKVEKLKSDDKKPTKVKACNEICSYAGKSASCKFRVGWALQHRFEGDESACPAALKMVKKQCNPCAKCSLAELGCEDEEKEEVPSRQAPSEEFDCLDGLFNWQKAWTPAKKDWCCKNKDRGCLVQVYNCDVIAGGSVSSWNNAKRDWCCQHKHISCRHSVASAPAPSGGVAPAPAPSGGVAPAPAPGPANLRANAFAAVVPPATAHGARSSSAASPGPSAPKTSGEALQKILVGLLTGPVAALAASLFGSFLALAMCKKCGGCCNSERQQDGYPPSSQGVSSVNGSPLSGTPASASAYRTSPAPSGPYSEMERQPSLTPRPGVPSMSRAASVPPGSRPGTVPLVSRAASVPPA